MATRGRMRTAVLVGAAALAASMLPAAPGRWDAVARAGGPRYLVTYQQYHTVMTRNFNPFVITSAMDFTEGGIYEPLYVITDAGGGHSYAWLATNYAYKDGNRTLLITIRHGVRWSDGVPFTARDVYFTFTLGRVDAVADQIGITGASSVIKSVALVGSDQVAVHFKYPDTADLAPILASVRIVPEHIWSKIKNPSQYANPNPVGTGPFTQVLNFSAQGFILGKNPYYWQPGKPAFDGIELPALTGNDAANLSMVRGTLDWTGSFVPNVQRVYVARDPVHFHYYYDTHQFPNGFYFNDEKYPYNLVGFRKAISYAIDRQRINVVAEYGYEPPSDALGLSSVFPSWVDPKLAGPAKELTTYNPAKAKALLAQIGFTLKGGQLYDPKGHAVAIQLADPGSFTDFVATLKIIQRNFQDLGINATIKLLDDNSFFDKANKGLLDADLYFLNSPVAPYDYFQGYVSKESYVQTGQDASIKGDNWARWYSPEATTLLGRLRQTTDIATQRAIVYKLERIQLDNLPYIPTNINALWYTWSTLHFTGWPDQQHNYAFGQPVTYPDSVKILTSLTPVG